MYCVVKLLLILAVFLFSSFSILSTSAIAVTVAEQLKNLAGCFKVTFNYVEDGVHDKFYDPVYEEANIISYSPFTLQRTLIVGSIRQLHWSESWNEVDASTQVWSQEVVGPFGDFRYRCEGTWTMNQWRCEAENAPKPRRDADRPYATLDRENTLQVNDKRWVHGQRNLKRTVDGAIFSNELGWNVYEKVTAEFCQ